MPRILDGKPVRERILAELRPRIETLTRAHRAPGLTVVLVGNDPASEIYVRNKVKTCDEIGIRSEKLTPPADIGTEDLLAIVEGLNRRDDVDGILVQSPPPPHIDEKLILHAIRPDKDVDGFHPLSVGNLVANNPGPVACTPSGVMEILRRYEIPVAGRKAVVVGRSDIVGKPMAMLLLHANATVTICHSKTVDLAAECRAADIVVAAIGRPAFLRGDYFKPGAIVIDVGINHVTSRDVAVAVGKGEIFDKRGSVTVGDVHPLELDHVAAYTPVPGGVGLLTVAMLMVNTVALAERHLE